MMHGQRNIKLYKNTIGANSV